MKAVVMEIRDNDVVLLCDDGSFTRARNRSYMIGDVIDMRKGAARIRFVAAAAAAAVVVLLASAGKNADKTVMLAEELDIAVEELELEEVEVDSEAVGYEMVQSAKALSMTPGKYNLITKHLGITVDESNVEEYKKVSVRDLMKQYTDTKGVQGKEKADDNQNKSDNGNGNSEAAKEKNADKKQAREAEQVRAEEPAQETAETIRQAAQGSPSGAGGR